MSNIEWFLSTCYWYGDSRNVNICKERTDDIIKTEKGEYELQYSELVTPGSFLDNSVMISMSSRIALNKLVKDSFDAKITLVIECGSFIKDIMILNSYIALPKEMSRADSTINKIFTKQGYQILHLFDETKNCYYKESNDIKAFKYYPDLLENLSKSILIYMSEANLQKENIYDL